MNLCSHFKRFIFENQMLEMITSIDIDLHDAWVYYHQYRRFNESSFSIVEAYNALSEIINDFTLFEIPEFVSLASTLSNWKQEIVNSFELFDGFRVSNGPIEGSNSLVKNISLNSLMVIPISLDSVTVLCTVLTSILLTLFHMTKGRS